MAAAVSLAVVFVPGLTWLNFPFRMLTTLVHELGHGLTALATGGRFVRFIIHSDGSGLAYTAGGWRFMVIPAGYAGVAVFGAGLILLGRSHRWSRAALTVIGGAMAIFSLRYGVPSMLSGGVASGLLATACGTVSGGIFLWVAWKAAPGWIAFLLHLVAIQAGITAFSDVMTVIGLSANFFNAPENDARSMAELTFIPAIVWALLWAIFAVALIGGAIWWTWLKKRGKCVPTPG